MVENRRSQEELKPNIRFTRTPGVPPEHPCYNCIDAQVYGNKVFCYRPGCRRNHSNDVKGGLRT